MTETTRNFDALDEFAAQKPTEGQTLVPAFTTHAPPPNLVHGAQTVLVPRDEKKVLHRIRTLASAAGDAWYYRIPFKDRRTNRTNWVEGPSIKLANDVARIYGACDVDQWVSGEGPDYWEFTARFIDLESGFAITRVFRQRKNAGRIGGDDSARNAEIGFAIGASKAIRNVICNALQTFADFAFEEARGALVEQIGKDIDRWRTEVTRRISALVELKRVEMVIGRPAADWLAPDIATVAALGKAIKDGMATVDESFPPLKTETVSTAAALDEVSEGDDATPAEKGAADDATTDGRTSADNATSSDAAPAFDPKIRKEATDKLLALVSNPDIDTATRLESLENATPAWEDTLEPDYLVALIKNCVQVAKGFQTVKEAKKVLETLK